ncbi:MAG TPA: trypsin-like peptidase domain-containing protein [Solirubrobacteraceae bacterium]|jgi:S1-C subfamily serine protease|nr:trypsin-like peptidase domain-containing protein [Solirubrobacteraceae bacterium]
MKNLSWASLVSALIGGAVVAAVLLATGAGSTTHTTTEIGQAPLPASSASASSGGLTPRQIYERVAPGVVYVSSQVVQRVQSPFDLFPQVQRGTATGSGFVIDKSGDIVTNAHVIQGAVKVTIRLEDKRTADAKVVGKDTSTDVALLKINPDGLNLKPLPLGNSKLIHVGDATIAIGNPFGYDRTLTTGVVSALQRQITAPNGFKIDHVIQTDAALNPGNSGGPLLDSLGRVIGINSQIATSDNGTGQGGNVGIGFAVPIDTAKQIIPQLEHGGKVNHAYLGLTTIAIDASLASLNLPTKSGALVQTVQSGSPADKAGIKGGDITAQLAGGQIELGGDIIVAVDGRAVNAADDLSNAVSAKKPGDHIKLTILRHSKRQDVSVALGSRPAGLDSGQGGSPGGPLPGGPGGASPGTPGGPGGASPGTPGGPGAQGVLPGG